MTAAWDPDTNGFGPCTGPRCGNTAVLVVHDIRFGAAGAGPRYMRADIAANRLPEALCALCGSDAIDQFAVHAPKARGAR